MRIKTGAALAATAVIVAVVTLTTMRMPAAAQQQRPAGMPEFLRVGQCYRIAFTIDSAPAYKVLELLDGGWVKAEVDAGSAQAQRPSFWVNTSQIVTIREWRCSD